MINDQTITCPSCGHLIPLSETLTKQLHSQLYKEYENKLEKQRLEFEKNEKVLIEKKAKIEAQKQMDMELKDAHNQLEEQKNKIEEFKSKELELRKAKRALEEEKKKIELEVVRRVDEERKKAVETALQTQAEEYRLKMLESEKKNDMMKKTIEDLKRKSEQGSMQIQGDVQEMDLGRMLRERFPSDIIQDVPTGIRGADLIHNVHNQYGQKVGVILWESKNTKSFEMKWVMKLKEDQGRVKADVAILATKILPSDVFCFSLMKGVWIVEYQYVMPMVRMIRRQLIEIMTIKQSLVGSGKKMEYLYKYLLSSQFKNKVENIVSSFTSLKSELESEKRAMQRIWSRREKEIDRVIENTSSFYGDLQGVIGDSLPTISNLALPEAESTS